MLKTETVFTDNAIGIDPPGCGCTDCLCGDSIPENLVPHEELFEALIDGRKILNRTGMPFQLYANKRLFVTINPNC